jgi:adenylate cyclase
MPQDGFKRKLAAILSADVEDYSRLMGQNEEQTIRTLTSYRTAISDVIQQYRGRVVDTPGDNILAEFSSVVDAVNSAVKIQNELTERNAELPMEQRMQFRIGVNLGDVIVEEGRIYGDGVNIAARVESMADAGGICISGRVYDQVENKLDWKYDYLGEKKVKNISRPIRVYNLQMKPQSSSNVASEEHMAFPLPDKPSIAVLPFDYLSGDPEQDYIADGISDNIITALSYIPEMFVIARNSSFMYKGKPVKVQQVSEELGIQYVLEGSVLKSGDQIRIIAQLIDALTGGHIWSGRYDRDFINLFDLIDEITHKVVIALQVKLTDGEQARLWYGSTHNLEAWGYAVKGLGHYYLYSKENNAKARELLERAIEIDPEYAHAITMLGRTYMVDAHLDYTESRSESLKRAEELAEKATALNDNDPLVHMLWEYIYLIRGQHDEAIEAGRKSIALGPNNAEIHTAFGQVLYFSGMFKESVEMCEKAIRLHPNPPLYYLGHLMIAYRWARRYDESLAVAEQLIERSRKAK